MEELVKIKTKDNVWDYIYMGKKLMIHHKPDTGVL